MATNDPPPDQALRIRRLTPADTPLIVDCFQRVYGDSYANPLFYEPQLLHQHLSDGRLRSVGALRNGELVGHMAMRMPHTSCSSAELGNTVVDPRTRGDGIAWRVGDALIDWCRALGYRGFLHYPTTDHHIMQRQSVKAGFETGLMLGYIPATTDGQVSAELRGLRQAATIVYQPLAPAPEARHFCPAHLVTLLQSLAAPTGLSRHWVPCTTDRPVTPIEDVRAWTVYERKRGLARLTLSAWDGSQPGELTAFLSAASLLEWPCQQLDLCMSDPNIGHACEQAEEAGFTFCGWLPGFAVSDVLRLQRISGEATDMQPRVVNAVAQNLLAQISAANV